MFAGNGKIMGLGTNLYRRIADVCSILLLSSAASAALVGAL